ncbi:hypothetical protein BS47DRAFT_671769 [Hydnum rufescens UP504]|uniref:Uncharacterized protein n=1 Tax=Hydnum rufescens UP504 TaxID=1448309 RepID=A0A9P6AEN1_9AGAM|nr:hypothetical protein BS47DRAFT_671769 [Hydnum rufescens UP504]
MSLSSFRSYTRHSHLSGLTSLQSRSFTSLGAFLPSLRSSGPSHGFPVSSWGKKIRAILSVWTREYFQSNAFVPDPDGDQDGEATMSSVWSGSTGVSWGDMGCSDSGNTSRVYWDEERKRQ